MLKASETLDYLKDIHFTFEKPKNDEHGDLSSNVAMMLSKKLKKNPRDIASEIIDAILVDKTIIEKIEIAGAGFINFYFSQSYLTSNINRIFELKDKFGKSQKYAGKKANVEFVSANPTGPLTVGHGRNAVCGDTISNLLEWIGYEVDREYYFNNAGRQMRVLGDSVKMRYLQLLGENVEFPADYYQGEYIKAIANDLFTEFGATLLNEPEEGIFKERAEKEIFKDIEKTLNRLGINYKIYFNENTLYEKGKIEDLINAFKEKDLCYEKDGALWLKLSEMGNQQDKVIVKSTGEPTYRLPDIAYHMTKFDRNYDLIIDLFGSDHNATYPDVVATLKALGYDTEKIKVLIHQFVTISQDGEIVKMSTRKANYITLDELSDEVGEDVVRYFFNMRGISTHMNFDLGIAKKHSDENPVFYLQYAHARICSIMKTVNEEKIFASTQNLSLLISYEELALLKKINQFEDEVLSSAEYFEPNRITTYLEELATAFHKFYTFSRILGTEKNLSEARLALAEATKIVLANGLSILGVKAPERM